MSERATCALCGLEGHDDEVRISLVEWTEPIGDRWQAVDRCRDRIACRLRVEAGDEVWPIEDSERDRLAWERRADPPVPVPVPVVTAAVAIADAPAEIPAQPPTWVAPFVDEPEEDDQWP